MSDENEDQGQEQSEGSRLRQQLEEVLAENKKLKSERWANIYEDAGLPEGAREVFERVYDGEASVEAVREYAEQAGFRLNDPQANEGQQQGAPEGQRTEAETQREQAQGRLDQAQAASLPNDAPSLEQQIKEAQANSQWETAFSLKSQFLNQQRQEPVA